MHPKKKWRQTKRKKGGNKRGGTINKQNKTKPKKTKIQKGNKNLTIIIIVVGGRSLKRDLEDKGGGLVDETHLEQRIRFVDHQERHPAWGGGGGWLVWDWTDGDKK